MNTKKFENLTFNLDKFPHLTFLQERATEISELIVKLDKRKFYLVNETSAVILTKNKVELSEKSKYEVNEQEILLTKTNWELQKLHKNLAEKNAYIKDFIQSLKSYIPEVNENFESILFKAESYLKNNEKSKNNEKVIALKQEFDEVKNVDLNDNWENRIKHYISLKNIFAKKPIKNN